MDYSRRPRLQAFVHSIGRARRLVVALAASLAVLTLASAFMPSAGGATGVLHGRPAQLRTAANGAAASTNWSGYAALQSGSTFTDVKGSWTQPAVSCPKKGSQYASFWVGLDGYNSNSVEQIGTDADCSRGRGVYYAWYEMYPAAPVNLTMAIRPGDSLAAEVAANGSTFTLTITNVTTGESFTTQQISASASRTSAEWVAEAPSSCFITCSVLPLANFGTVNFSGSYATANGHNGSISDGAWTDDSITMVTKGGTAKAVPSALSADGTSFSVTWRHQ